MDLLVKFKQFIAKENLFQKNDKLLLAVSGGVDSVVLCELCKQAGYNFVMAHCNFQLRGEKSERDELFVKALAEKYGMPVFVKKFNTKQIAAEQKKSIETAARDLRYSWFHELAKTEHSLNHILTAHHADDNIETVTMNFFRGTGIAGVRGMLPRQGKIIRPLLFARRKELETFVAAFNLEFVTDETNFENDYTRNFFRNKILPLVTESYPEAAKNILHNIRRLRETELLYQQAIDLHKHKLVEKKGNEIHIPVLKLNKTKPLQTILYEIIKDFDFTAHQVVEVIALLESETGKYIQSNTHRIIKNRKWLIITPNNSADAENILIEAEDKTIHFEAGILKFEKVAITNFKLSTGSDIAQLDATTIQFPLLLRKWKQGDYFYPLGMKKKKKLSRFFIDQKLSLPQKESTWVIEMDKKIIWVVGMRIDDRFKVIDSSKSILKIALTHP